MAYRSLPVSDLPNVDFPTLLVTASLPGASPDTMASAVATPLENQFSNISGLDSMTSTNSLGSTQVTLEFVPQQEPGWRGGGRAIGHHAGRAPVADGHAHAADVHQGESRRSADSVSRHHLANPAALDAGRIRRNPHCPAHFDGLGRRASAGVGRAKVRRACAAGSALARIAPDRHQRSSDRALGLERQPAHRKHHRSRSGLSPCRRPGS